MVGQGGGGGTEKGARSRVHARARLSKFKFTIRRAAARLRSLVRFSLVFITSRECRRVVSRNPAAGPWRIAPLPLSSSPRPPPPHRLPRGFASP